MPHLSWTETIEDEVMKRFELSALRIDECLLNINNLNIQPIYLYKRAKECDKVSSRFLNK